MPIVTAFVLKFLLKMEKCCRRHKLLSTCFHVLPFALVVRGTAGTRTPPFGAQETFVIEVCTAAFDGRMQMSRCSKLLHRNDLDNVSTTMIDLIDDHYEHQEKPQRLQK